MMSESAGPTTRVPDAGPLRARFSRSLAVLAYHSMSGGRHRRDELRTSVGRLAEHLDALSGAGYQVTGLTEALDAESPTVALTFDDAYADFLDAMPVIVERRMRATLYAPSGLLGRTAEWMAGPDGTLPLLTRKHLASLAASGIEIGSHGRFHRALDIADSSTRKVEIEDSRHELEDCTGTPVQSFAYPYGYWSARCRRDVATAGYDNACVLGHTLHRRTGSRYTVRRLLITSDDDVASVLRRVRWSVTSARAVYTRSLQVPWQLIRWSTGRDQVS